MSIGRKQSLYFSVAMIDELMREGDRLDRSVSWIVQRCIRHAMPKLREEPSSTQPTPEPHERGTIPS